MPSLTRSAKKNHKNVGFRIVKDCIKRIIGGSFFSNKTTLVFKDWNTVEAKSTMMLDIIGFRIIKITNSKGEKS